MRPSLNIIWSEYHVFVSPEYPDNGVWSNLTVVYNPGDTTVVEAPSRLREALGPIDLKHAGLLGQK